MFVCDYNLICAADDSCESETQQKNTIIDHVKCMYVQHIPRLTFQPYAGALLVCEGAGALYV